ncbi:hypothetical protein EXU57_18270 [Segetibacter sp. 3557_3]|uniref:hypothetical protein n=1 Tax=Segetibacter sp. 3557_3 TaxID=2547429 RepID=UPI0010588727|nr:hypothetical protein [Segetibacter sp. 3557_3]TDH23008.1 hypothetical protein EXU57_18270 [Segetibacter sp. 3557_3]
MRYKRRLFISAVLTVVMIGVMQYQGVLLKTPQTPMGILDLEFAGTVENATRLYNTWLPVLAIALNNVLIDFLFIICYTLLLHTALLLIRKRGDSLWRRFGNWMVRGVIIAGFFDVVENILMLRTLNGHISKEVVASTFMFAAIKFLLIVLAIAYILLTPLVMRKKRVQSNTLLNDLQ